MLFSPPAPSCRFERNPNLTAGDRKKKPKFLSVLEVLVIVRNRQVVESTHWRQRRIYRDLPPRTGDDSRYSSGIITGDQCAQQIWEGYVAFADNSGVDKWDGAYEFDSHISVEVRTTKYQQDIRITVPQASCERERCRILLKS